MGGLPTRSPTCVGLGLGRVGGLYYKKPDASASGLAVQDVVIFLPVPAALNGEVHPLEYEFVQSLSTESNVHYLA